MSVLRPMGGRRPLAGVRSAPCVTALLAGLLVAPIIRAADVTDCFADRVVSFRGGTVSAPPGFNTWQPGILLGPPGDAAPNSGSLRVMSLGKGGEIVLEFTDNEIVDGPGPDFIVFENPFYCTAPPLSASDPYSLLAEPGLVAVSDDGLDFRIFPYDAAALSQVVSLCTDKTLIDRLRGLLGITASFTGNYTIPDDPLVFDPGAPGGVSGHGGDAFDLAAVGLTRARFVRITDPSLPIGLPGSSEGLDLDTVVALHSRPRLPATVTDFDGDGLSDQAETLHYGTDPHDPDSDGDGIPDGREAAACRDPRVAGSDPFFVPSLDLEVVDPSATLLRWNDLGGTVLYDAIRGVTAALAPLGSVVDLGVVTCLENDSIDLTTRGFTDAARPFPGEAFFYLVRPAAPPGQGYGPGSDGRERRAASGDCQ